MEEKKKFERMTVVTRTLFQRKSSKSFDTASRLLRKVSSYIIPKRLLMKKSFQIIIDGISKIVNHTYKSNWVVAYSRYDVLLGIP